MCVEDGLVCVCGAEGLGGGDAALWHSEVVTCHFLALLDDGTLTAQFVWTLYTCSYVCSALCCTCVVCL